VRTIVFLVLVIALSILADSAARIVVAHAANNATAIVPDTHYGIIRIIINGKEAARFTADGLWVRDDIQYGGRITDTNITPVDKTAGESDAP